MILADSNLIIYAASGNYPDLIDWFAENQPVASAVSLVEVLGYYKPSAKEKTALEWLKDMTTPLSLAMTSRPKNPPPSVRIMAR
jgi:predicted nucleic acid-binding protein